MGQTLQRRLIQLVVLPVAYFLGAKASLAFAMPPDVLVMLWLPNSLLLAALLHYRLRDYGYFAAMIIVAEIAADHATFSVLEATLFSAINLIEVTLAYLLLRRWRFDPRFLVPGDIAKFLLAGPGIAALVAACLAAAVYTQARGSQSAYLDLVRVWWFSDATGLLIFTPLILGLWAVPPRFEERLPLRWFDAAVGLAAVLVLALFFMAENAVFRAIHIRPVLLFPFVIYAAARLTPPAATAVVATFAAVVLFVTRNGQQPFGDLSPSETVRQVQQLVLLMTVTSLGLSALLAQLRANTRELESRVQERTAELRLANERLQQLTITDPLTELPNRRALHALMQREIERSHRHRHNLSVIMFDLDRFKQVNDRYGHAAGDAVLRHVAEVAAAAVRGTDTVARYGGEEFVIVAPETDVNKALQQAERVRLAIAASPTQYEQQSLAITASFGVATLSAQDTDPEALVRRADAALYAAKAAGRNCVVVDPSCAPHA